MDLLAIMTGIWVFFAVLTFGFYVLDKWSERVQNRRIAARASELRDIMARETPGIEPDKISIKTRSR